MFYYGYLFIFFSSNPQQNYVNLKKVIFINYVGRSSQHPTSTLANAAANSLLKPPLVGTVQPTARCLPQPIPISQATTSGPIQRGTITTSITVPVPMQKMANAPAKFQKTTTPVGKLTKSTASTSQQPASSSQSTSAQLVTAPKQSPITAKPSPINKASPSNFKPTTASTKPHKITNKRSSTDQPTPSTSTPKAATKRYVMSLVLIPFYF
jgi:hypothetical protein